MSETRRTPLGKCLFVNLNEQIYGTFAEIGAGQEVARFFFQAGRASQTIAKTISAYDMTFSDEIYGKEKTGRYVVESRLNKMLEKEYNLLERRLKAKRGENSTFFAFANTVATASEQIKQCHGWMGIRFQAEPNGPFNDIIMHVRMLDRHRLQQQEVIGILGVNLVYSSFFARKNLDNFLSTLTQDIKEGRLAIDVIRFLGPDIEHLNAKHANILLVSQGLCDAVLFGPDAEILNPADAFFNKALIVQRGLFSPLEAAHTEKMQGAQKQIQTDYHLEKDSCLSVFESTITDLKGKHKLDTTNIVKQVEHITSNNHYFLISNFSLFYQLKNFVRRYSKLPFGLVVSSALISKLFDDKYYKDLDGGLLEGLGKLLDETSKLYAYPHKAKDILKSSQDFSPKGENQPIFSYFKNKNQIIDL